MAGSPGFRLRGILTREDRDPFGGRRMPLHLYPNVHASGSVPESWRPVAGAAIKYPVRNPAVKRHLRELLPGRWQKVIKKGNSGEVHYFEHASGQAAGVKFLPSRGEV
jgi:hypothetical protein